MRISDWSSDVCSSDLLILLTAGAGGNTGWLNPFSFVSEVRKFFDGPVILAGGISNGRSLAAARVLGADMVAAGTSFIAATESAAPDAYREILIDRKSTRLNSSH